MKGRRFFLLTIILCYLSQTFVGLFGKIENGQPDESRVFNFGNPQD